MEKIITILGKNYKAIPEKDKDCKGCSFNYENCEEAFKAYDCTLHDIIFQEVTEVITQTKPTIQMNLELDLSSCILPVFFTVKNLRLQSLDAALKNQSDAYNISVKDLPQETLEIVAEALKQEFIKRNTKVHDV